MPFSGIGINETPDVAPAAFEARLGRLVELGYETVEVRLHHVGAPSGAEPVVVGGRLNGRRVAELVRSLDRAPLRRTLHASQIFPGEPALRQIGVEIAEAMVDLGEAIGAEVIVVHPESAEADDDADAIREEMVRQRRVIGRMAERAAAFGARVAMENMTSVRSYASDPVALCAEVAALHAAGHTNVGICLDVGHMALAATARGFDFVEAVRRVAPLVVHTHMSDNFGRPAPTAGLSVLEQMRFGIGDLHLPFGWGNIPHDAAFAGADLARSPLFLYELNQGLRGSLAEGAEEQMVADARRHVTQSRGVTEPVDMQPGDADDGRPRPVRLVQQLRLPTR